MRIMLEEISMTGLVGTDNCVVAQAQKSVSVEIVSILINPGIRINDFFFRHLIILFVPLFWGPFQDNFTAETQRTQRKINKTLPNAIY